MNDRDIVKSWKDRKFRIRLSAEELAAIPASPAGFVELDDSDLEMVTGGKKSGSAGPICSVAMAVCCHSWDPWASCHGECTPRTITGRPC